MKKKLLSISVLAVVGGLLTGCDQRSLNQGQLRNGLQKNQQLQSEKQANSANRQGKKFIQSDYQVDASDKVQSRNLLASVKQGELSTKERAGLVQMREEEKLAHDVYVVLYEKWGQRVFSNISRSEQSHTDTVKYLLDRYGVSDPVKSTRVGVFTDPKMKEQYASLVAQGSRSLVEALKVGATVEDLDIKDLEELLLKTDNEDIKIAYQNLNKGSRNHLRAFVRNLESIGGDYTPQFISLARFDEILAGKQERGPVNSKGEQLNLDRGNGQGVGQGGGKRRGDSGQRRGY